MLPVKIQYLEENVKSMKESYEKLPTLDQIQEKPALEPMAQEAIRDILVRFMDITEHILSRFERSTSPTYKERVRSLADTGLFDTKTIEYQLIPLAVIYENRISLQIALRNRNLKKVLGEYRSGIGLFIEKIEKFLENPAEYGFQVKDTAEKS